MSRKKLRILNIANMNSDSGVACFVMNYLRVMDKQSIQMDFICWDKRENNFYSEIEKMGGKVFLVTSYKNNLSHFLSEIKSLIEKGNYDIIHGHEAIMSLPALHYGKKYKVPVRIAHSHSSQMTSAIKKMVVILCRRFFHYYCTNIMACSQMAGDYLFGAKFFNKKGVVLHNAIDVEGYRFNQDVRKKMRQKLGLGDELVIGHVGRFNLNKNQKFLIQIFERIYEKRQDARLLLIGEGETKKQICQEIKEKKFADSVIFLGVQKNVNEWMQAMDVFVFPSFNEGLGIALVEAQASGLPCCCSDTIPKEAKCSKNVKFISLTSFPEVWADSVLDFNDIDRNTGADEVKTAGYDIAKEGKKLQDYYLSFSKRV